MKSKYIIGKDISIEEQFGKLKIKSLANEFVLTSNNLLELQKAINIFTKPTSLDEIKKYKFSDEENIIVFIKQLIYNKILKKYNENTAIINTKHKIKLIVDDIYINVIERYLKYIDNNFLNIQFISCDDENNITIEKETELIIAIFNEKKSDLFIKINLIAYQSKCKLLITYLEDSYCIFEPLIIPNITPCYECIITRENSNLYCEQNTKNIWIKRENTNFLFNFHYDLHIIYLLNYLFIYLNDVESITNKQLMIDMFTFKLIKNPILKYPNCNICTGENMNNEFR